MKNIFIFLLFCCLICSFVFGELEADDNNKKPTPKYYFLKSTGIVCVKAPCPSWEVTPTEGGASITVHELKFAKNINESVVFEGKFAVDVIHRGILVNGIVDKEKSVRFEVDNSYRVLPLNPQDQSTRSGRYYHVDRIMAKCKKEPCPNFSATELNTGKQQLANKLMEPYSNYLGVDQAWLNSKILTQEPVKAIVQANIFEGTIIGKAIYVNIVDPSISCPPLPIVDCIQNYVPVFKRDSDRCLHTDGCVKPGFCTLSIPVCQDGYRLTQFRSKPNACPSYHCDAWFLSTPKQF
ncbi:hypothetical protein PPL_00329 [Heterostelium album PN500]|uniref:Uncharacterized protein n=1 Tax=Heterostelium pallidum (strain ATCC 26659 / Pp 5 / PN500) TaxID=670386 RepID=D3AW59_HETP5|nr:hypothetical protein PPL_00329 [Heterostelium album PN500]EFA86532.1 hypothetical protein PPL_00329 [Heterostelium album PN500]|eukprot:XP_020438637.1 hypothetical protein PPL_00329 [Heterostelium album PN500]